MALEAVVFQQDPFCYGGSGPCNTYAVGFQQREEKGIYSNNEEMVSKNGGGGTRGSSSSSFMVHQTLKEWPWDFNSSSSSDIGFTTGGPILPPTEAPAIDTGSCRRRRRRPKSVKNKEEIENQRMIHIAVERNRRKQMNDYLAVLRTMMPNSYVQRGDQASIIGGAINFVKVLEQILQSLEARKRMEKRSDNTTFSSLFSDFFPFPQYSTSIHSESTAEKGSFPSCSSSSSSSSSSSVADVEVTMVDSHANVKILSRKHPKQFFNMVSGLHSLGLFVLHLNVTSVENRALYSLSVKVEENCQLNTVNEIAAAVYEMVDKFQEEAAA